jgi:hypothetical protein
MNFIIIIKDTKIMNFIIIIKDTMNFIIIICYDNGCTNVLGKSPLLCGCPSISPS